MFLAIMIGKVLEKSPLRLLILQCMSVFNPQELAQIDSSDSAQGKIRKFLYHLLNLKLVSDTTGDKAVDNF